MNGSGDYWGEMGSLRHLSEHEIEMLLAGKVPAGHQELDNLVAAVRDVKMVFSRPADRGTEKVHLSRIVEAARSLEPQDAGLGQPGFRVLQDSRRKRMLSTVLGSLAAKIAAVGVAAAAATGGLAATGNLPDPAQEAVSDLADRVGISISSPSEEKAKEDLPAEAQAGMDEASRRRERAQAYAKAVRDWTACVAAAAKAQGDEGTRQQEPFDPTAACGPKPDPAGFGLTDLPEQADDRAREAREEAEKRAEEGRSERGRSEGNAPPATAGSRPSTETGTPSGGGADERTPGSPTGGGDGQPSGNPTGQGAPGGGPPGR